MLVSARQTRARVAFRTILRSMRSVDVFICTLLVAYYISMLGMQPFGCGFHISLGRRRCGRVRLRERGCRIGSIEQPMLQSQSVDDAEQPDERDDFSQHHE